MQAVAEMFNRPVHVHEYSVEPLNTFQPDAGTDNPPLRVSYHAAVHYNSLVDPNAATIGIGLGLPGFKPGLADAQLVHDAVRVSEQQAIEEAMLADKLAATDWEATEHSLQQQVARQSYVEWLQLQSSARKTTGRRSPKRDVTLASEKHLSPPLVQHPHERTASAAVTSHGDGRTVRDKAAETADALTTGMSSRFPCT
jgi:OTU domain-containing protein 5